MAAYAALVSLLNNIQQMMNHPRLSTCFNDKHIQPLVEKATMLLHFIEEYNYCGEDLERQIASAAHAAEDIIESHIVDQIHARTTLPCSPDLLQLIIQDMDALIEKATDVKENPRRRELEQPSHPTSVTGETTSSVMVGLDDELIQLLDELTGHQSSRHIISIVGMGGMGKTTLAKNIYGNSLIMEHFEIRAWATISQQYKVEEILSQLLSSLGKRPSGDVGEQLHKTLMGRRYLIVLDDIWSVEAWDRVRPYFPDDENGSRVVLTTRLTNVAKVCGSSCFQMNLLDEDKSWKLFCEKAFLNEHCPPQLEEVGKEIVRLCKGLALSIVVIGGLLLKSPRTEGYWEDIVNDLKSVPNSKEKQESLDVLSLSYTNLPPHLKPCFLYMGVYKEDSQIRVSNVIQHWIGEGFLKPIGFQDLEEIAECYLKDLIDRNLILVVKRRKNGKIGRCGIHDLLRDLCIKVGVQQEFFHENKKSEMRGTERRFIGRPIQCINPLARSIVFTHGAIDSKLWDKYRLLRVLDEGWSESPAGIYGNVNLRYLSYEQPYTSQPVWELPTSMSLIWNLQTLIIKGVFSNAIVVAPTEILKMRQLRHAECRYVYLPPSNEQEEELMILENLQILKRAVNFRLCENMIPNIKELNLDYDGELQGYDDCLVECLCNLDRLHRLEVLKLNIKSRWPTRYPELNKKLAFPRSLNKLSLSYCDLEWEDLTMIGSLPQLEVLNLGPFSVISGTQWSPVNGEFLRLKFLEIKWCELICWDADESHFPVLEKLVLWGLTDMEEIPPGIGEIATLELIHVVDCSDSAAISAVKIKEDQLENQDNDGLQVQLTVQKLRLESFNQRLETEGLTINNIQFVID